MAGTLRNDINAMMDVYTERDSLISEYLQLSYEFNSAHSQLLHYYLADSVNNMDSIAFLLKHPTAPAFHYRLAELYFNLEEYALFDEVVDSIPLLFNLSTNQNGFHNNFVTLYTQLKSWKEDTIELNELSLSDVNWLISLTQSTQYYPSAIHTILSINDTFVVEPVAYIPYTDLEPITLDEEELMSIADHANAKEEAGNILMYPNPAGDEVILERSEAKQGSSIHIYDINGRIVYQSTWKQGEEKHSINTSGWQVGIYYVTLQSAEGEKTVRKLMIVR